MRKLSMLIVMGLLTAVSSCGGGSGPTSDAEASPSAEGTSSHTRPTRPGLARQILGRAVGAILSEEVTWFSATSTFLGDPVLVTEGLATTAGEWKATTTFTDFEDATDQRIMLTRSVAGSVWMQMRDWPPGQQRCWAELPSRTQVPMGISGLTPFEPAFISILGSLKAIGFTRAGDEDQVTAEIGLNAATALINARFVEQIDLTPSQLGSATVEVVVGIEDDRVAELKMLGEKLLIGFEMAGATVSDDVRAFFDGFDVTVGYPIVAGSAQVSPPPADLVMQFGDEGC